MLGKLGSLVGIGGAAAAIAAAATANSPAAPEYTPYTKAYANHIYNMLFCDRPQAYAPLPGRAPTEWHKVLFAKKFDARQVAALAADTNTESRVRAVAYHLLRMHGATVPKRQLLGVIVEMPIEGSGLDVLAAFVDGRVRYINHAPSLTIIEDEPSVQPVLQRLLATAQGIVDSLGPWDQPRLPPPAPERFRLSFIVSDGLYFGDLPMSALTEDPRAAPIMQHATELLQLVTKLGKDGVRVSPDGEHTEELN